MVLMLPRIKQSSEIISYIGFDEDVARLNVNRAAVGIDVTAAPESLKTTAKSSRIVLDVSTTSIFENVLPSLMPTASKKVVRVSSMKASSLPDKKPLFGNADPYVIVFIKDADKDVDQSQVKKTKCVKSGDEISWENESFDLAIPEASDKNTLCFLIYTFDGISSDQLLGCAEVCVEELEEHGLAPDNLEQEEKEEEETATPGVPGRFRVLKVTNNKRTHREMSKATISLAAEVWTSDQMMETS